VSGYMRWQSNRKDMAQRISDTPFAGKGLEAST
jgi:hypothetical protein